jgi:hypothetical protein
MSSTWTKRKLFVLCAGCWGFAGIALADTLPPVWFPATGTAVTSWSNEASGVGFYTFSIPFQFNFLGTNYTSATLSSNGLIYFSPPGVSITPQPQASSSGFRQGAWPLIAPAWYDIQDIDGAGSLLGTTVTNQVFVDALSNQVVITFQAVASIGPPVPLVASDLATFQVSLDSDGSIIFAYKALNSLGSAGTLAGQQEAIIGVTPGVGAADPGSLDLSSAARIPGYVYTSTGSTVYQAIDANPPDGSNLAGLDLIFTPEAGLTWKVTSNFPGDPAPEPSTLIEITFSAVTLLIWRSRTKFRFRGRV